MIPHQTIQAIQDAVRIQDVVGDFIQLKQRGVSLIGLCPFHNEKTPSFNVSVVRNIYKCFGCGEGGNAVNFVMKHENCSYPEALRFLAKKYGIPIEEAEPDESYREAQLLADSLYLINEFAQKHFHSQMFGTDYGQAVGLSYFKERGLREDTLQKFGLGFANGQSNDLCNAMISRKYEAGLIQKAGLMSQSGRDFFRTRVMFPIHNVAGKVIGFGGRILTNDKNQPKYLNTPETEIYIKNKSLYGIHFAKKAIAQADECWLVEGYMDVLALHQSGMEHTVASSGTSLTVGQIQLIKRYTNNITILYDGDAAGLKAALRGLDLVLEQGMNVRIVLFPKDEDPDSYLKRVGETTFREYVKENKQDFIIFKTNLLLKDTERDPLARANALREVVLSLTKIIEPLKRAIYVKETAILFEIEEERIHQQVNLQMQAQLQDKSNKNSAQNTTNSQENPVQSTDNQGLESGTNSAQIPPNSATSTSVLQPTKGEFFQEKDIIRILILFGDRQFSEQESVAEHILVNIWEILDEMDNELFKNLILEYIQNLESGLKPTLDYFLNHSNPEIRMMSVDFATSPEKYVYSEGWAKRQTYLQSQKMPGENHTLEIEQAVNRFKIRKTQRLVDKNRLQLKNMDVPTLEESETLPPSMITILEVDRKLRDFLAVFAKAGGTTLLR